ncbi:MAG: hypothetical protein CSB13_10660 [Chloroflexi bacterium]|nr:MAG: hypothetical protein CSB13_10660 [Chloroflexota bacterium]
MNDKNENYYLSRKPKLMKDLNQILKFTRQVLTEYFDEPKIDRLLDEIRREFEELIPQIPYIGGDKSSGTRNIVGGAMFLAIIWPLEREGLAERDIGKVIYQSMYMVFNSKPYFVRWLIGKMMTTKFFINHRKKQQPSESYPYSWENNFLEAEGQDFDLGLDVTKCGIVKLFKEHDMENYVPYACLLDYCMFKSFGLGFERTQTIGNGAPLCDFRFKKVGETAPGWPPETLQEFTRGKGVSEETGPCACD